MKMQKLRNTIGIIMVGLICFLVGCSSSQNSNKTANASTVVTGNYKQKDLGRIRLTTHIDEENGNVIYMIYDNYYDTQGHKLEAIGMTSQPINKSNNSNEIKNSTISDDYKEEDLGRIRHITYFDKENNNIIYISYDNYYDTPGHKLEAAGMTSQPIHKVI